MKAGRMVLGGGSRLDTESTEEPTTELVVRAAFRNSSKVGSFAGRVVPPDTAVVVVVLLVGGILVLALAVGSSGRGAFKIREGAGWRRGAIRRLGS